MPETTPHYLVITLGTTGDIHPFMRVANTLRELGREVTFITYAYHAKQVRDAGLSSIGLGAEEDYPRVLADPDLWNPRKSFASLMANYRQQLDEIIEAIRSLAGAAPLVAICHPFAVPGAAIARESGLVRAVVGAHLAPASLRSCHDPLNIGDTEVPRWVPMPWRRALLRFVEQGWIDPVPVAQINAAREAQGLAKVRSLLGHIVEAPDLLVTLFPPWFAPPMPDWPRPLISGDFQLFDASRDDALAADLSAFLAAGDQPVVFTPGTGNLHAARFFACALAAVERLGRRAVFLTRERAQVPAELPGFVSWQPYVPLSALLPHAAALVHHGGIGTTAEALRAGTPQLVTPFAWDQFDNGARIAALGVGRVTPARRLRPQGLARELQTLLSSAAVRDRCAQVAARFTPPHDPGQLCRQIDARIASTPGWGEAEKAVRRSIRG